MSDAAYSDRQDSGTKRRPILSPMRPSKRATTRIKNPLPIPSVCPHDGGQVEIVSNEVIYGRPCGEWPWVLLCSSCGAYARFHRFTGVPVGTLATAEIRQARKQAGAAFDLLWEGGQMTRDEAYEWLAHAMGMARVDEAHIGRLDIVQCQAVLTAVTSWVELGRRYRNPAKVA